MFLAKGICILMPLSLPSLTAEKNQIYVPRPPFLSHLVFESNGVSIWQNNVIKHRTIDLMGSQTYPYTSLTNFSSIFIIDYPRMSYSIFEDE